MKISRKSWHYKFLTWLGVPLMPSNLCTYFWATTLLVVFSPIMVPLIKLIEYLDNRVPEYKEPGLVRLWVRARKEKVCPLIEYED